MIFSTFVLGPLENNCYIFGDENSREIAIVDAPVGIEEVIHHVKNNNLIVKFIVITHKHFDHVNGLEALRAAFPNAEMIANSENISFNVGNISAEIIHTPGHTQDGICVYLEKEKILFSGDTLFFETIGRTDLPGGNFEQLLSEIKKKLLTLPNEVDVYPGHDRSTTIEHERNCNKFLT